MLLIAHWLLLAPLLGNAGSSPQVVEGLVNIRFQADARIFAVMAVLNMAGFELDAERLQHNAMRKMVRERMHGSIDEGLGARLEQLYKSSTAASDYHKIESDGISFALHLGGPPRFLLTAAVSDLPEEIQAYAGLERLVAEIWQGGVLPRLWEIAQNQCLAEIEAYRPQIRSMIIEILKYMHTDARVALDRQVIFSPELLGGYGSVNARNVDSSYIIVVGPSATSEKPMRGIRHEYLHFMIDPLLAKYNANLPEAAPFMKRAREQKNIKPLYARDFTLMLTESLLKTIEMRLDWSRAEDRQAAMLDAYDRGLILVPYFAAKLEKFEESRESLQECFPRLIEGLSWDSESKRHEQIERMRQQMVAADAARKARNEAAEKRSAEIKSLLAQANEFLKNRDFEKAKDPLQTVLALEAQNANALFGMAQIALHEENIEPAYDLFGRAAANAGAETWIAAWSHVQRGKLDLVRGATESAKEEWNKALRLEGNLRGAAEAAKKALAGI